MKAKKKTIEMMTPNDLGVDPSPRIQTLLVSDPPVRKAGIVVNSVNELVEKLRNEAKVI
jgi:electron transfer flavoprotein beta subunit